MPSHMPFQGEEAKRAEAPCLENKVAQLPRGARIDTLFLVIVHGFWGSEASGLTAQDCKRARCARLRRVK